MTPLVIVCAVFLGLGVFCFAGTYAIRASFREEPRPAARNDLRALYPVAEKYRVDHPGACPTVPQLVAEKELAQSAQSTRTKDMWGSTFEIACEEDETYVSSRGPDHILGTADDITIPERGHR